MWFFYNNFIAYKSLINTRNHLLDVTNMKIFQPQLSKFSENDIKNKKLIHRWRLKPWGHHAIFSCSFNSMCCIACAQIFRSGTTYRKCCKQVKISAAALHRIFCCCEMAFLLHCDIWYTLQFSWVHAMQHVALHELEKIA